MNNQMRVETDVSIVRWWLWPTVLSLDAPAVTLVWQSMTAAVGAVALDGPAAVVLGSSVWLAYVADRWIEGWRLTPVSVRTVRHAFYQRHRWVVLVVWLIALGLDVAVAARHLSWRELQAGCVLLVPVIAYLLSHQLVHRHHPWRVPKEGLVALLLTAGVGLFPLARGNASHAGVWLVLLLFALLCFTNCALISMWEHDVDRSHGQTSLAMTQASSAWIRRVPWLAFLVAAAVGVGTTGELRIVAACAAASAVLLVLIDTGQRRIGIRRARVLADVALLTPLAPVLAGWLS
jgi:hypothetical protein